MEKTLHIKCLKCNASESYIRFTEDGAEYGECCSCGNTTYKKMSHKERVDFENAIAQKAMEEQERIRRNQLLQYQNSNRIRKQKDHDMRRLGSAIVVACPYCHSTDTKKITMTKKAIKTILWGFAAAGTVTKEWHCNNCGSDF